MVVLCRAIQNWSRWLVVSDWHSISFVTTAPQQIAKLPISAFVLETYSWLRGSPFVFVTAVEMRSLRLHFVARRFFWGRRYSTKMFGVAALPLL
jgi:hypothetical protein